ncbi:hypothetical protein MHYP_G00063260 [Metynnis hypsauchen]
MMPLEPNQHFPSHTENPLQDPCQLQKPFNALGGSQHPDGISGEPRGQACEDARGFQGPGNCAQAMGCEGSL